MVIGYSVTLLGCCGTGVGRSLGGVRHANRSLLIASANKSGMVSVSMAFDAAPYPSTALSAALQALEMCFLACESRAKPHSFSVRIAAAMDRSPTVRKPMSA